LSFHQWEKEKRRHTQQFDKASREPGLLATESRKQFLRLRKGVYDQIQPRGAIEHHYADRIAILTWEVLTFHRIKAELINCALLEALENLLKQAYSLKGLTIDATRRPKILRRGGSLTTRRRRRSPPCSESSAWTRS
jgi:hypothetical protein